MDTEYDVEIRNELKEYFDNEEITIENALDYFDWIEEYFPIGLNRIDWEQIPNHKHISVNVAVRNNSVKDFIDDILNVNPSLKNSIVIVFGDDLIRNAYKMTFDLFMKNSELFFDIPQHTYVVFDETKQCFNYTFEDDFYFGTSLKA